MKTLFMVACLSVMGIGMTATAASAQLVSLKPEATQDVRDEVVLERLKAKSDTVLIYANGLCCPSCSSGVRATVGVLDFVDQTQPNRGVEVDAKHQLVVIAVKKGAAIDTQALTKAVDAAGYPPVHLYTLEKGKVVTQALAVN